MACPRAPACATSRRDAAHGRFRGSASNEFLAIVTHPRVYAPPSPVASAIDQIGAWMESPSLVLIGEPRDHSSILRGHFVAGRVHGPMVHDARIAAICVGHGVRELLTADRDFSRFPSLTTRNPLVA